MPPTLKPLPNYILGYEIYVQKRCHVINRLIVYVSNIQLQLQLLCLTVKSNKLHPGKHKSYDDAGIQFQML